MINYWRKLNRLLKFNSRQSATGGLPNRSYITGLFRNIPQLRAIRQLVHAEAPDKCSIAIYGVADGAEAVSLLACIDPASSGIEVTVDGFDISHEYIAAGREFTFPPSHFKARVDPEWYRDYLVKRSDGLWQLRTEFQPLIRLHLGDVCAIRDQEISTLYDIVACQNVLVGFSREDRLKALEGLCRLVRPGGLLLLGSGPLGEIHPTVLSSGFAGELNDVEAIHEAWTIQRQFHRNDSPPYWALEPFNANHPEGAIRYCSIFRKIQASFPQHLPPQDSN